MAGKEPSGRPAQIGSQVPDLPRVRIGSATDFAVRVDPAADARRERHVEQRRVPLPRPEFGFADGPHTCVVVHDGGRAGEASDEAAEIEIVPAVYMCGKHHALLGEIDGPAEPDPAAFEGEVSAP